LRLNKPLLRRNAGSLFGKASSVTFTDCPFVTSAAQTSGTGM
jgi:hypothetical protein